MFQLVLSLVDPFLGCGRTIVTDNYFTSSELGRTLYQAKNTQLLGTIRRNRTSLPKEFVNEALSVRFGENPPHFLIFTLQ